ncbi:MAG: ABC transporter permease [Candidatus Woesearchaeota archaeon]
MIREFLVMLLKDLKLFLRDKKMLFLVTFTPLLIMVILCVVFGSEAGMIKNIKVGVCNFDNNITFDIAPFKEIYLEGEDCEEYAKNLVYSGKIRAAVIIPENFEEQIKEGKGGVIKIYTDNSKPQISVVVSNAVAAYAQSANEKLSVDFIEKAWENLKQLNEQLVELQNKLSTGVYYSKEAQKKIDSAFEIVKDIRPPLEELESLNKNIEDILYSINSTNLSGIDEQELHKMSEQIRNIPRISYLLQNISEEITLLCNNLSEVSNGIAECEKIKYILAEIEKTSLTLDKNIEEALKQIDYLINHSNENEKQINEINNTLLDFYTSIESTRENITIAKQKLSQLLEEKKSYNEKLLNLNKTIANLTSDLENLNQGINETREVIEGYTLREPKTIIKPISFEELRVFPNKKYIHFIAPALICIILLFVITLSASSNVVYERKSGTMVRNVLSPVPIFLFMLEKLLYFMFLSALQLFVMLVALSFFKVSLQFNFSLFIIFFVVFFSFNSLGLIIGTLSKSENTALLTSLVISIPMLFLSGSFFAYEIMPSFMQNIAKILPLTVSIEAVESVTIYKTPLPLADIYYLLIVSILLFLISVLLVKKEGIIK